MSEIVPFGEWRPDVSTYRGQHSPTITNVIPQGDGYGPFRGFVGVTAALEGACRGMFTALDIDGTISIFAATATRLYKMSNTDFTWGDVSKTDATKLSTGALTSIGDMTDAGGLAAGFDGTTAQAAAACAAVSSGTTAYIGKTLATSGPIRSVIVYGSNDAGFVSGADPSVTIKIYAKAGTAPASGTDGTVLATLTPFSDTADESAGRSITSTDLTTIYDHVWVYITHDGAAAQINVAELEIFMADDYALGADNQWQFVQQARKVIATNGTDNAQVFTLGTSSVFADLGGSPPVASYAATVNQFTILSGLSSDKLQIQWCSRSDPTEWTAGTNEGDVQSFSFGGEVRGVAGGEYGLVFQDNAIRRMTYAPGSAVIFEFDIVAENMGLLAPYSIIRDRDFVFFLSNQGFQKWHPSEGFTPIGRERVDRTFMADWDDNEKQLMLGVNDVSSSRVMWFYKSVQGTADQFDRVIVYDWVLDRWAGFVDINGQMVGILGRPGVTLEALDSINSSIDALTLSLDEFPTGFGLSMGIADENNILGTLTGDTLEATVATADICGHRRIFIRATRPASDAATVYSSVTTLRQKPSEDPTFSTESQMNAVGFCPHRIDTRLARIKHRIPAGEEWTYITGTEPELIETGRR